jgi:hypothetical protein
VSSPYIQIVKDHQGGAFESLAAKKVLALSQSIAEFGVCAAVSSLHWSTRARGAWRILLNLLSKKAVIGKIDYAARSTFRTGLRRILPGAA